MIWDLGLRKLTRSERNGRFVELEAVSAALGRDGLWRPEHLTADVLFTQIPLALLARGNGAKRQIAFIHWLSPLSHFMPRFSICSAFAPIIRETFHENKKIRELCKKLQKLVDKLGFIYDNKSKVMIEVQVSSVLPPCVRKRRRKGNPAEVAKPVPACCAAGP